jgi:hypothetical protein
MKIPDSFITLRVVVFFAFLTIIMTYPMAFQMGSAVRDLGDPLLNAWILNWDIEQILHLNIQGFFQANIFYPHRRVLAYSEHMFPNALLGLPVYWISQNPILVHNFVLLFAFVMDGVGMYLLAYHLSRHRLGSLLSGIMYAFSPFMMAHLFQVQVVSAWGIPLSFLFLDRFLKSEAHKDLLLFAVFYLIQILSNGYYALYLTLFSGLFFSYGLFVRPRYSRSRFVTQMVFFVALVLVVAGPFFYQYLTFKSETKFVRECAFWADLTSYWAAGPINRMYGKLTAPFLKPEGELFPGILAAFSALIGIYVFVKESRRVTGKFVRAKKSRLALMVNGSLVVLLASSFLIHWTGGFKGVWGNIPVSAQDPLRPLILASILLVVRFLLDGPFRQKVCSWIPDYKTDPTVTAYLVIGFLAFLFSLGPKIHFMGREIFPFGPYHLLYDFLPGFDGLRVSSRFFIFVIFSLSLFAALGLKWIEGKWGKSKGRILSGLIILITLMEYLSIPIPLSNVPVKESIPEVYQWLSGRKQEMKIVELPLPTSIPEIASVECLRVYYSSYHWKKIFNGFSGYIPPKYVEVINRMQKGPLKDHLTEFQELGLEYVIWHQRAYDAELWAKVQKEILSLQDQLTLVGRFGEALVYRLSKTTQGESG